MGFKENYKLFLRPKNDVLFDDRQIKCHFSDTPEYLDSSTYVLYSREEPILAGGATAEILPLSSDPDNTGVEKQSQITV